MRAVELFEQNYAGQLMGQGELAEGESMVDVVKVEPERAADDEAQVEAALPPLLEKSAKGDRVELLATAVEQRDERSLRQAPDDVFILPDLGHLNPRMPPQELVVMLAVVGERRPQPPHGNDSDPHYCDTTVAMNDADRNERRINIHFSPEIMAGAYANFANVSHSDYEFTITFARVDHEVEDEEIPGVVVSRINLSAKFMRELIDAMQDNYSKWETREGIKNLPEFGGSDPPPQGD